VAGDVSAIPITSTYFFLDPGAARLKIGKSINVPQRLRTKSHEVGTELILVATIPRDEEKTLHAQFRHARLKGEWFNARDAALAKYLLETHGYRVPFRGVRRRVPTPPLSTNDLVADLEDAFGAALRPPEAINEWLGMRPWEPDHEEDEEASDLSDDEMEEWFAHRCNPEFDFADFLEDWQEEFIGWGTNGRRVSALDYTDISVAFWRPGSARVEYRLREAVLNLLRRWDEDDDAEYLVVEPYFVGRRNHEVRAMFEDGTYNAVIQLQVRGYYAGESQTDFPSSTAAPADQAGASGDLQREQHHST
jgi:hypothetical protein